MKASRRTLLIVAKSVSGWFCEKNRGGILVHLTPEVAKIRTIVLQKNESVPQDASCTAEFLLGAVSRYVRCKLLDPIALGRPRIR